MDLYYTDFPGMYMTEDGYYVTESGDIYDEDGDLIEEDAIMLEGKKLRNAAIGTAVGTGAAVGAVKGGIKGGFKGLKPGYDSVNNYFVKHHYGTNNGAILYDKTKRIQRAIDNGKLNSFIDRHPKMLKKVGKKWMDKNLANGVIGMADAAKKAKRGAKIGALKGGAKAALAVGTLYGAKKGYDYFKNANKAARNIKNEEFDLYETDMPGIYVTEDGYYVDSDGSLYDEDGDLIEEDAVVLE